jgi:threonine/homoserine/homoserine lactone efflux protein
MTFVGAGVILGLSAGFSPGPLLALVIAQTLKHGVREGIKVALAPLITDLPIILICSFLLSQFIRSQVALGGVSLVGGVFVSCLALDSFRAGPLFMEVPDRPPQSLGRGVLVNFLSPHPYLFWMSVGAPMMVKAWNQSPSASVAFIAGFYVCLVGAKVFLAVLSGKCRQRLTERAHRSLLRILGLLLLVFAGLLFQDGFQLLGWFS